MHKFLASTTSCWVYTSSCSDSTKFELQTKRDASPSCYLVSAAVLAVACTPHVTPLSLVVFPSGRTPWATLSVTVRAIALPWHLSSGRNSSGSRALPLAEDCGKNVSQTKEPSNHGVTDDSTFARCHETRPLGESETKATVNDSEDDGDSAEPDVAIGPDCALVVALEENVVNESKQRLERKKRKENYSDDWVCIVQCVEVPGHPDADTESRGVEDQAEYLE